MAVLIEGITDNKNRSINEIKLLVSQKGGKIVNEGAIKWMFERRGVIGITDIQSKEEAELLAIEAGAEDILWEEDNLIIYTKPEEMENVKNNSTSLKVDFANLEWVAKEKISADEEKYTSFIEAIEDHDDVSNVYTNIL